MSPRSDHDDLKGGGSMRGSPAAVRQELIYYPDEIPDQGSTRVIFDVPIRPSWLYTCALYRDPDAPPPLPVDTTPRCLAERHRPRLAMARGEVAVRVLSSRRQGLASHGVRGIDIRPRG